MIFIDRVRTVGETVHYWTTEGDHLLPNAAIVVAVGERRRLYLHVFWATGFGGRDCVWADEGLVIPAGQVQIPREGHWTFRDGT